MTRKFSKQNYKSGYAEKRGKLNNVFYITVGLFIIFSAALTIRLNPVISKPEKMRSGFGPFGDTFFYQRTAYNLYKGRGFSATYDARAFGLEPNEQRISFEPTAIRGPVYPFFMCSIYRLFCNKKDIESGVNWPQSFVKIKIIQCIMDALVCILIFFIVRTIYSSSLLPAFIASILYCFCFYNIFYTSALLSESLTTFIAACFVLFFLLGMKNKGLFWWLPAGIFMGLLALSRFEYSLFIFIAAAFVFLVNRKLPKIALTKCFIFIFGAIIIISPWTIRNYIVFKKFIPVSGGSLGYGLWQGTFETNKIWTHWSNFPDEIFSSEEEKSKIISLDKTFNQQLANGSMKIFDTDRIFMRMAVDKILKEPVKCFINWLTKIPRLWYQFYIQMYAYKEPSGIYFIFYFLFALYAFIFSKKEERIFLMPIIFLFIYLTLIFLPIHVEPRYGVAIMPAIICLSGIGIWKFLNDIVYAKFIKNRRRI